MVITFHDVMVFALIAILLLTEYLIDYTNKKR